MASAGSGRGVSSTSSARATGVSGSSAVLSPPEATAVVPGSMSRVVSLNVILRLLLCKFHIYDAEDVGLASGRTLKVLAVFPGNGEPSVPACSNSRPPSGRKPLRWAQRELRPDQIIDTTPLGVYREAFQEDRGRLESQADGASADPNSQAREHCLGGDPASMRSAPGPAPEPGPDIYPDITARGLGFDRRDAERVEAGG